MYLIILQLVAAAAGGVIVHLRRGWTPFTPATNPTSAASTTTSTFVGSNGPKVGNPCKLGA